MQKLDWYIVKKFLGTFFFSISLILLIVVVFDISEKIDDFIEKDAPLRGIIFDYYLNFIPYFGNLFSPLFTFVAVIFFTSKMANNTEVISILSSGISFNRFLRPFMLSAGLLAVLSFTLSNFIIPPANSERLEFENTYIKNPYKNRDKDIHMQIKPGQFIYMQSYNTKRNIGYKFSMEQFENNELQEKLFCNYIKWNETTENWTVHNYFIRKIDHLNEEIIEGDTLVLTINLHPNDFNVRRSMVETMNMFQLNDYIKEERMKGSKNLVFHIIEQQKRFAYPFATLILTIVAVAMASRKVRGGIGLHLGLGLLISFAYILFMQVSTTFATNGDLSPIIAVWIPNLLFASLGLYLLKKAPK
ncbi:MAG: LptF/LptG family permease [Flavobacteriales bacterium]|nr:YjgP/YjgQ family permease [Flavobacteriia bacterium]|tara:strand:- start:1271 stop:2347 length:1077 start_codon:yes stop_codon:yes gene_type:complete